LGKAGRRVVRRTSRCGEVVAAASLPSTSHSCFTTARTNRWLAKQLWLVLGVRGRLRATVQEVRPGAGRLNQHLEPLQRPPRPTPPPPRRRKMAVLVRAKPERRRRRGSRAAPRRSPSATTDPSASAPRLRPDDALAVLGERGEMSSGPRRWNAREIISMRGTERTNERTGEGGGQCLGSVAVCGRRSRCVRRHRSVGVAPGPGGDRS